MVDAVALGHPGAGSAGRVELLWARLESWLGGHVPDVVAGLAAPADEATLSAAQVRLGRALPGALRELLTIHDGGQRVIGGWDLLSAGGIVGAHEIIMKYADEPERVTGWIPFVETLSGDFLCLDMTPGPGGVVGQVFMYRHDDEHEAPIAADLPAWLERIVACVEAGTLVYDVAREEFLPFYGATGFAIAFDAEPPFLVDASRPEVPLVGPRPVVLTAVESVGPLRAGARIELVEDGTVAAVWDLDGLRESEDCVTDYNILIDEPGPTYHVATPASLRVAGLTGDDTMWIRLG